MPAALSVSEQKAVDSSRNPAADSHEIRGLTGIRGFAALLVVTFHFYDGWTTLLPSLILIRAPISRGYLGVDLFFILSGFILSYVYHASSRKLTLPEYGRFLWFRLARIYPNHLATLLILVFFVLAGRHVGLNLSGSYSFRHLPIQLLLLQAWPYFPSWPGEWNYPCWSISAEWFAYLAVFPLVVLCLRHIRNADLSLVLGFGSLVAWPLIARRATGDFIGDEELNLIRVSCEFLAGGLFFNAFVLRCTIVRLSQRYLTGLFALALILLSLRSSLASNIAILATFTLLLFGLTAEVSLVSRLFSTAPALWLGRVSYALYMSHSIPQKLLKFMLPVHRYAHASFFLRFLVFMGYLAIIMAAATALYYLVEIPSRNFLKRIRPPCHPRDQVAAGSPVIPRAL